MELPNYLNITIFGYKGIQWITLFGIIFLSFVLRNLSKHLLGIFRIFVSKTKNKWDDQISEAIEVPFAWIFLGAVFYFSVRILNFQGNTLMVFSTIAKILLSLGIIWSLYRLASVIVNFLITLAKTTDTSLDDHLIPLFDRAFKVFIVTAGVLVALQNIGINVYSLVAGLGIGGLALALAAKDTAANFFGSIMILIDRPFRIGDWVKFGDYEGTVEDIGFRSTRMRTFYDSQVYLPNSLVANANIDNMGRRRYRRVLSNLGLNYDTSPEKLEAFLEGIKNIILANDHTKKDYFHVVFNQYESSSLNVMVYFFLEVPNWSIELSEKQNIFIEIYRLASEIGVEFAFPTQSIHMEENKTKGSHPLSEEELLKKVKEFSKDGSLSKPNGLGIFKAPYKS